MPIDPETGEYKSWWEEELDLLDGELDSKPVSSRWRSKLGEWFHASDAGIIGASNKANRLSEIAERLARPVNAVRNATTGEERHLKIGWSEGRCVNGPAHDTVFLSPTEVLAKREGTKNEELVIDALTGQVLLAGTMKRTCSGVAWARAEANHWEPADTIWRALETAVARGEILKEWPGYADYLKRHADQNCASKEAMQQAIDSFAPTPELVAAALAWNLQFPANKVQVQGKLAHALAAGFKVVAREHHAEERFDLALAAANAIAAALAESPPPPPPPPPGGEGEDEEGDGGEGQGKGKGKGNKENEEGKCAGEPGEDEEEGEGEGAGGDGADDSEGEGEGGGGGDGSGDSESEGEDDPEDDSQGSGGNGAGGWPDEGRPPGPTPEVNDPTLFGEPVPSNVSPKDIPAPVDVEEVEDDFDSGVKSSCDEPYNIGCLFLEEQNGERYSHYVAGLRPYIQGVHAALRFRNNDVSMWNRGVSSGDLDEGSLDKLVLHEQHPNIWERKELIGQPRVAVGMLIDESGSMQGDKQIEARKVAITLVEALRRIRGVDTMVLGFETGATWPPQTALNSTTASWRPSLLKGTAAEEETYHGNRKVRYLSTQIKICEYYSRAHKNPYALVHTAADGGTPTDWAVQEAVKKMLRDYASVPRRILFVLDDGQPCNGRHAMQHLRQISENARRNNVGVYGVGVCNAYTHATGVEMYGEGNFAILQDVMSSLPVLTAFLRQVCVKPV